MKGSYCIKIMLFSLITEMGTCFACRVIWILFGNISMLATQERDILQ